MLGYDDVFSERREYLLKIWPLVCLGLKQRDEVPLQRFSIWGGMVEITTPDALTKELVALSNTKGGRG